MLGGEYFDEIKKWKFILAAFLIILGVILFLTPWNLNIKGLIIQYAGIFLTGIGFYIAIYQLKIASKQYFEENKRKSENYLDLKLKVKQQGEIYKLATQVMNKSGEDKEIFFSFLLITKQEDNIIEKVNDFLQQHKIDDEMRYTNDFIRLRKYIWDPFHTERMAIIPLPFYYSENIYIGNESPGYTYAFDNAKTKLEKGIYSVRFFIYPRNGYHRSTTDSLIVN